MPLYLRLITKTDGILLKFNIIFTIYSKGYTSLSSMKKHILLSLFILFAVVCQAQTVYKTKTGSKYHLKSCHYLKSSFETTVAQAQAEGLTACSVCKPSSSNSTATYNSFKSNGKIQTGNTTSSNTSSGSVQCCGTTKAGARCKRKTTSSTGRCYQH